MNTKLIEINRKKAEIKRLKEQLTALNEQRLINAEYVAAGDPDMPYDPFELHQISQQIRAEIKQIEDEIATLESEE